MRSLGAVLIAVGCFWASDIARASEVVESLKTTAISEVSVAEADAKSRRGNLVKMYAGALVNLEKSLVKKGDLDAVLHVRAEREAVEKTGSTTAHDEEELVDLRAKYQKALGDIDEGVVTARGKVATVIAAKIKQEETILTRAGKIKEALALRKEGENLVAYISGGAAVRKDRPFTDDPRAIAMQELEALEAIKVPTETPPEDPRAFANDDRWLKSLTVPTLKQRVREAVIIGDRAKKSWPLIAVAPGSFWVGVEKGRIELSAGKFLATHSKFEKLFLDADLSCEFYFKSCDLKECRFDKGGVWYGSELAGKFYFENCVIRKTFAEKIKVTDNGYRAEACVFDDIEFPSMRFDKKHAADYVNHPWLRLHACRFVRCKIPMSILLLTRNCVFENCVFVDDAEGPEVGTKPIETVLYLKDCKSKMTDLPANVTIVEKAESDLTEVKVPTLDSLVRGIGR